MHRGTNPVSGEVLDNSRFPAKVLRTLGNDALDGLANCAHALSTSNRGECRPQRLTSNEVELAPACNASLLRNFPCRGRLGFAHLSLRS